MNNLQIGSTVYHYGECENSDKRYKVMILRFDCRRIAVKADHGAVYFVGIGEITNEFGQFYI